jgi:hypothetical protein
MAEALGATITPPKKPTPNSPNSLARIVFFLVIRL